MSFTFGSSNNNKSNSSNNGPSSGFSLNTTATSNGLTGSTPATTSGALFGGSSTTTGGNLFGSKPSASSAAPAFSFGGDKKPETASTSSSGGFSFGGASKPTSGLFGSTASTGAQTPKESPPKGLFGAASSATTSGGGLFGSTTTTAAGNNAAAANKPLFSLGKPAEPSKLSSATSASENKPAETRPTFSFGGASTGNSNTSLFGAKTDTNPPAFSLGGPAKPDQNGTETKSNGGFSFGVSKPEEKKESKQAPTGSFSFASTANSGDKADTKPAFGFGAPKQEEKKPEPKSLFGTGSGSGSGSGSGTTTDNKEVKTESKPLFGAGAASSGSKPLFGAGTATTTTASSSDSKPLFGATASNSSATAASASAKPTFSPATTNQATETPAPEITPSTYLKNRSFEDIIAKWSGSLARSTDGFKAQAAEIRKWDRELVENGEKITALYNDVVAAEQGQGRVDQLLEYIDKQQNDLEGMLNVYDKQADNLMTNFTGKEGLQPTDQERERTYKLAEDLDDKLESMGQNLSGIIEEINKVGHELNHSRDDDPITQIVKILNAQLSSLQWIDQSTEQLQQNLNHIQELGAQTKDSLNANETFRRRY